MCHGTSLSLCLRAFKIVQLSSSFLSFAPCFLVRDKVLKTKKIRGREKRSSCPDADPLVVSRDFATCSWGERIFLIVGLKDPLRTCTQISGVARAIRGGEKARRKLFPRETFFFFCFFCFCFSLSVRSKSFDNLLFRREEASPKPCCAYSAQVLTTTWLQDARKS